MLAFIRNIQEARRRDDGASAVEYGLLVAAIAAVIVVAALGIGAVIRGAFTETCNEINQEPIAGAADATCE